MTCRECRKWWSPYLDSELDASTTFEVSEHLRTCRACRERFEREEFVENWLRDRLRDGRMPDQLWGEVCRGVRGGRGDRRLPLRRTLALAASIAMLITAAVLVFVQTRGDDNLRAFAPPGDGAFITVGNSVSDILQDRVPSLVAFREQPQSAFDEELRVLSRKCLDAEVHIDPAHGEGHTLELIGVSEQHDRTGERYLEIRLNCCGRPMLVALAKSGCGTCIEELQKTTGNCKKKSRKGCPKSPPIEAESTERNGVMIAAATADHYLAGVLSAISIMPIER